MSRKIALKKLTRSDLTIFEYHFRNGNAGNQKSINLNRNVLEDSFYPNLTEVIQERDWEPFILNLTILGPGTSDEHTLPQKIIKGGTYKNWRLNGKLIPSPEDDTRYQFLQAGDFAIMEFIGAAWPTAMRMTLIAANHPEDTALHAELTKQYGSISMKNLALSELEKTVDTVGPALHAAHPIRDFLDAFDLEDAAQGGITGTRRLRDRRKARGVTHEELSKAKKAAETVGWQGEELVEHHLSEGQAAGHIECFRWVASENAIAPYDFEYVQDGKKHLIDVKSTTGPFTNPLHVSLAELREMAYAEHDYLIYRLSEVKSGFARLMISRPMRDYAHKILSALESLPEGVQADSVSINPSQLHFEKDVVTIDIHHEFEQV